MQGVDNKLLYKMLNQNCMSNRFGLGSLTKVPQHNLHKSVYTREHQLGGAKMEIH